MQRIDFYVLGSSDARERLKFACRVAEKSYLEGRQVLVWLEPPELQAFDDLLWTFADRSFVPHELFSDDTQWRDTPVLLSCERAPTQGFELLLNLAAGIAAAAAHAERIIELVDAEPQRRQAARGRFRHYRERGVEPQSHTISGDNVPG